MLANAFGCVFIVGGGGALCITSSQSVCVELCVLWLHSCFYTLSRTRWGWGSLIHSGLKFQGSSVRRDEVEIFKAHTDVRNKASLVPERGMRLS